MLLTANLSHAINFTSATAAILNAVAIHTQLLHTECYKDFWASVLPKDVYVHFRSFQWMDLFCLGCLSSLQWPQYA